MKRAIRYLRFSQVGQSNSSIERQELYTDQWLKVNGVELVDTFIDRGKSAKTFDRPDFIKLQQFIAKHFRHVDYLLVDQLDRFSRDAGEAMSMVKNLQRKYNIQVVSVSEGITFDYDTPGSFFRAGLQLLLAEEDNINRSIKVRGGLYTAKAKEGRYVYSHAPFGYKKEGERKQRRLVIDEREAPIIRYIFEAYLKNVPLYLIKKQARLLGHDRKGNMAIERILSNPAYAGMLYAEPFKEYPGGLFPATHEPIIDWASWQLVQRKMKKPSKQRTVIDDEIPLRGLLRCHCGQPLTGAASRGKSGKYFYYYKCKFTGHNNISAKKAHEQLLAALSLMSLSAARLKSVMNSCQQTIDKQRQSNLLLVAEKKKLLEQTQAKLLTVEEKWIKNEIKRDTYQRWHSEYTFEITSLKAAIGLLGKGQNEASLKIKRSLHLLTDIPEIFASANSLQKREVISLVFDNNLYYENGTYRTPTMMELLTHNTLKMKQKELLIFNKKEGFHEEIPPSAPEGIRTPIDGTGNHNSIH